MKQNKGPYHAGHPRVDQLTKHISLYLAKSLQPVSILEEPSFRRMLQEFDVKYQIPATEMFSLIHLPALCEEVKVHLIGGPLLKADFIALSTEVWMSNTGKQFLSITAHILSEDWKLQKYLLDSTEWHPPYDADHVKAAVQTCLSESDIPVSKLSAVTIGSAMDILRAGNISDQWSSIPCFKSTLKRVVQEGLSVTEIENLAKKCFRLSAIVNQSTSLLSHLRACEEDRDSGGSEWETVATMFAQVLAREDSILEVLASSGVKDLEFSKADVQTLEGLVEILQPMMELSEELGEQGATSAATIWPSIALMKTLLCPYEIDGSPIKEVKKVMFAKVKECFNAPSLQTVLSQICFLDPRFKSLPFMNDNEKTEVRNTIAQEASRLFPQGCSAEAGPSSSEPQRKKQKRSLASLFEGIIPQQQSTETTNEDTAIQRELQKYCTEEALPLTSDPLQWWSDNCHRFPILQKLSRKYLCIPASSVIYSGNATLDAKRAALSTSDVRHVLFLHANMPDDFFEDKPLDNSVKIEPESVVDQVGPST